MNNYRIIGPLAAIALVVIMAGCTSQKKEQPQTEGGHEILVFAAASLRESMQELGEAFEQESGVHVVFNFAGSNELAQQIIAAPKADLFLSAAENWMDTLQAKDRIVTATRKNLLTNTLVVIAEKGSTWKSGDPCALASIPFKHIALGDPKAVPAGKYARQWLQSIRCGDDTLWNAVADRVAPAPDVRAALGLVLADPDVIGIVYRSDWLASSDKTRVLYEVKDGPPIRYVVAQVAGGPAPQDGRRFLDYLNGAKAHDVFQRRGFTPLSPQTTP
jgi:molybdate transport system substrate-binding protein